jgi:protein-S-isoprenylcysteine O-methyltransferase Ste14
MNKLQRLAVAGMVRLFVTLLALLFLPVWTFDYWQAWTFLVVFFASCLVISLHVLKHDPALFERRVRAGPRAEKKTSQKIIQSFASVFFIASILVPAIDHRFGWSTVPSYLAVAADVLVAIGFLLVFRVFRENSFASATVEVQAGQRVVSTGPYAWVRHPMYLAAVMIFIGIPVALGSWWGLMIVPPAMFALVWRLLDEEELLAKDLPGYPEYQARVRYRLVPGIW